MTKGMFVEVDPVSDSSPVSCGHLHVSTQDGIKITIFCDQDGIHLIAMKGEMIISPNRTNPAVVVTPKT